MTRLRALHLTRRLIFNGTAALILAAVVLGLFSGTAFAHSLSKTKEVYRSGSLCVEGDASLNHGVIYGHTESYWGTDAFAPPCTSKKQQHAGNIRVRLILSHDNGSGTSICRDTGWVSTTRATWRVYKKDHFSDHSPCGSGEYTVTTNAYVYESGWRGDIVYPGWHYFS